MSKPVSYEGTSCFVCAIEYPVKCPDVQRFCQNRIMNTGLLWQLLLGQRSKLELIARIYYRILSFEPKTSYGGTSPFACAIEYQSSVRISKGDCPKPENENRPALATFVGQRSELEVNSHESIIGHCHWSAVGLMAYFGFILGKRSTFCSQTV
ncbi:hypothetical protein CEXT_603171 [Caerostris extrusa]|uniref:Uncharacterized protein n=1 Tax=Caerostris extrusa TaxID=172846 RepID=A0AAV4SM29_CAEEX|nr:hypothetical protein CEXT_603171 [Caerostris extrusa]